MTYIELTFLLFLLVTVGLFYLVPVKHRWIVLLVMSVLFYGFSGVRGYIWILLTSLSVWIGGCKMGRIYEEMAEQQAACADRKQKKVLKTEAKSKSFRVLLTLLILNIGVLCVFKYTHFLEAPINSILRNLAETADSLRRF